MSKGNMLLGHARGKVGSLVFSRANGKQIVRSRAEVVKNPRTEQQMVQRIMLNTIAQAYSQMKAITDHSFQGLSEGQACMSFFMQRNLNNLRKKVATQRGQGYTWEEIYEFSPLKTNFLAINDYEIAKGTLPSITTAVADDGANMGFAVSANTYQAIIDDYGLKRGDQLTFVAVCAPSMGKREFHFARVILDPRETNGSEAELSTAFANNNVVSKANNKNEGSFTVLKFEDGVISFNFGQAANDIIGSAIIVSRKAADGSWLRSNATLVQNSDAADLVYTMQDCLTMLQDAGLDSLSDLYLNNAGVGALPAGHTSSGGGTGGGPSGEG